MKITTITASYDEKRSNGNYGSTAVFCSITATLDPDEDADAAYEALYRKVKCLATCTAKKVAQEEREALLINKESKES